MKNFQLSELTEAQLLEIISLNEKGVSHYSWLDVRGIYPLLILAERGQIQAWAEVSLASNFADVKLTGTADGVLAKVVGGTVRTPYLVIVEAKRSIEAKNPRIQFFGQLLVAAKRNWQARANSTLETASETTSEIYGCYTIGDVWTFARATVQGLETEGETKAEKPLMIVETSREYVERVEAETILKILKKIIDFYEE